jgi:lysozyme family protein
LQVQGQGLDGLQVQRWGQAVVARQRVHEVQVVVATINSNSARYRAVASKTRVPWFVISGLHQMESSGSFKHHLHEGSPLTGRTRDVPKGRPVTGSPPFTWEYSAEDALRFDRMDTKDWEHMGAALTACEGYNGLGYAKFHPSTPTPYLWAATSVERPGKYTADGRWSPTARSSQLGIVCLWKELERQNLAVMPCLR